MKEVPRAALPKGYETQFDGALVKALDRIFADYSTRINASLTSDLFGPLPPYTPTLTGVTNVAASSVVIFRASQDGDYVNFGGQITVDPSATGAVELSVTLPKASNFSAASDAFGTVSGQTASGYVVADPATDRLLVSFTTTSAANQPISFTGGYILK